MGQAARIWVRARWWQGVTPTCHIATHCAPDGITQATIFLLAMSLVVHVVGDTNLGMFTAVR
ncbi:hypothetical protein H257_09313 [Aphanomyces astaci]|uniref:Uncharacterized protein n=1 Tax=Aphanomyces astaci TaxID=112090 RepID=W4GB25_APHAT|nr:hypothetical protein H257_09313 [Aphanomyces astaci]ETV76875.1 hypothetical protein H257_09313 [Aphanomyces astaci]|eukprot:XP_009833787.1 hypothetical protein H257_09313 [Aphanomyces astaci]